MLRNMSHGEDRTKRDGAKVPRVNAARRVVSQHENVVLRHKNLPRRRAEQGIVYDLRVGCLFLVE